MAWSLDEVLGSFSEDAERPISPFGNEMSLPWAWQVTSIPVAKATQSSGEGLDDTDEFIGEEDPWIVTLTNKNQPGKQLSGVAQWERHNNPRVLSVDHNDFNISDEFARRILFAAYWTSDEVHHYEGRESEVTDIEPGDLFHLKDAELEMMKYLNDPEHYNKNYPEKQQGFPGWNKVGTVTHESAQSIKVNGYICSKMINHDLWIIQGDTWHWPRQVDDRHGADPHLYSDPDEIMKLYPDMYIGFLPSVNISDYYDISDEPPATGDGLDDVDEFEPDDPEVDLQRTEDAEHMAARAVRESMFNKFATLDVPGFELLYVGAKGARESDVPVLRPFVIVGKKKPVTEDLDDKDEFTGEQLTPVATTIIYDPTKVNIPSAHVILIAGRIIIDNGYDVGEFVESGRTEKPNEVRIFGKLEISENIVLWIHDAGGQIELHNYNIDIILESPDVLALNRGIDA